ncbi:hypothetical protein CK489_17610 [Bradyrhizobium sp. UFLA03-84]|uniref:hypothetical protein n=1 Tax=Bradyrhizobium sp. UFLA03-84 TaxID=418599 RepID=UPI000BAE1875|nr:hypothetical protein [Bradyrhizobium sp. UFLA03-84]PAY07556.1 hypothetical protein CK489_17610 [Bradyrhizobium sp. UFLA03-84]
MKRVAVVSAVVVIVMGSLASTEAAARSRRGDAVAVGIVGGLAVGALLGSTMTARAAPAYVYEREYYPPAPVVHYHHHVYEYGDEYPGGYDHGYTSGYREGYSDGYWDND